MAEMNEKQIEERERPSMAEFMKAFLEHATEEQAMYTPRALLVGLELQDLEYCIPQRLRHIFKPEDLIYNLHLQYNANGLIKKDAESDQFLEKSEEPNEIKPTSADEGKQTQEEK